MRRYAYCKVVETEKLESQSTGGRGKRAFDQHMRFVFSLNHSQQPSVLNLSYLIGKDLRLDKAEVKSKLLFAGVPRLFDSYSEPDCSSANAVENAQMY